MKVYGAFLCFGQTLEATVKLISDFETGNLSRELVYADGEPVSDFERARVYRRVFGMVGVEYAVPCWIESALEAVFMDEKLPQRARAFAARIYKGKTYSHGRDLFEGPPDSKDGGGKDGGVKELGPGKPKKGGPGGGAVADEVRPILRKATKAEKAKFAAAGLRV